MGSGGSGSASVALPTYTPSGDWQRYTTTFTVPSLSGKTIGTNPYLEILLDFPEDGALVGLGTWDIWGVQLEAGSVATPFRRNANSIQGELAACQRYYQMLNTGGPTRFGNGICESTTAALINLQFPKMRAAPSVTASAASGFAISSSTGTRVVLTAISAPAVVDFCVSLACTVASGLTAGNATNLFNQTGSIPTIELSAEL
jgi:hypothetical protein